MIYTLLWSIFFFLLVQIMFHPYKDRRFFFSLGQKYTFFPSLVNNLSIVFFCCTSCFLYYMCWCLLLLLRTIRLRKLSIFYVCELRQKHSKSVGSLPSTEDGKIEVASPQFELKTDNSDPSISPQPTWRLDKVRILYHCINFRPILTKN